MTAVLSLSSVIAARDTSCRSNSGVLVFPKAQNQLRLSFSFRLWMLSAVCHDTVEMRGVNGGSCRHDTPALNSLLLQEGTEESFSLSSSLLFLFPPWNVSLSSSIFPLSLTAAVAFNFLSLSSVPATSVTHTEARTPEMTFEIPRNQPSPSLSFPYPTVPP